MNVSEFDYHLPEELIAQKPLEDRAASRMLVIHRQEGRWEDRRFRDLPEYLGAGDRVVINNSKVMPSRIYGRRKGVHAKPANPADPHAQDHLTGTVEFLLLRPVGENGLLWRALVRPGRKLAVGEQVHFAEGLDAEIVERGEFGERLVRFQSAGPLMEALEQIGHVPLPPYIKRDDEAGDRHRYQTVYADQYGSVAAPTAGLHFTPEVMESVRSAGADFSHVTLHVGLGTFQPLHTDVVEEVKLHGEIFEISDESYQSISSARRRLGVGTTSVRTMETAARSGIDGGQRGETDLYIYPGFEFRWTNMMLTNFHLPKSSLMLLVCAFGGKELMLDAYRHAVAQKYRFYSYGDCMLIL